MKFQISHGSLINQPKDTGSLEYIYRKITSKETQMSCE